MSNETKNVIIAVAAIAVIAIAVMYVAQRVHYGCLFGNCAVILSK